VSDPEPDWLASARTSQVADDLHMVTYAPGECLFQQGDAGHEFLILAAGHARVRRNHDGTEREIADVGPGALLGELSLLTDAPRANTVTALDEVSAFAGDEKAFERLLDVEPVRQHFALTAAERLARMAEPVETALRNGVTVQIRPLLPQDRSAYLDALGRLSQESLRNRFFTPGQPPASVIDYLLDIDYARHFAWVVTDPSNREHPGVGVARYVNSDDSPPDYAELAMGIADEFQGQGLGTILMGALGVAAHASGFTRLGGEVLSDNLGMRRLFDKAGAEWVIDEPGVVRTDVAVDRVIQMIDPELAARLERSIHNMGIATSIALT
jgi:CRP-like cAMP-binding protein